MRTITRTHTRTYTNLCDRCEHPQSWHRLDDAKNISPTDPAAEFRCIGYDCEVGGKPPKHPCTCPDYVPPIGDSK